MEDEARPLPNGWVRSYDPESEHQFFVDTTADPPRSIWHHPFDDEQYVSTLDPHEREIATRLHRSVSLKDIEAESSDDEAGHGHGHSHGAGPSSSTAGAAKTAELPPRPSGSEPHGLSKFGRKMKDKITHSTHEEREKDRQLRAEQEQAAYQRHLRTRQAFARAMETGQPQYLGKDSTGRDVYIESPYGPSAPDGAYGYNPYAQGPYANRNARFVRPQAPYGRPYGYGYGGGYGFPIVSGPS